MNAPLDIVRRPSVCPHDCPSVCALDVEVIAGSRIGRVHGARDQRYTAGVVCAKVARYSERIHHPDRLTRPLRRVGPKGSGEFKTVTWDDALDITAEALHAERLGKNEMRRLIHALFADAVAALKQQRASVLNQFTRDGIGGIVVSQFELLVVAVFNFGKALASLAEI